MQLVPGLTWAVSYSYLDTKLIKAEDRSADVEAAGAIAGTATPIAVQGDTLPFAPDHTVVTSLTYNLPLSPEIGSIDVGARSEEHTSELQSLMRISYAVFCL